MTMPKNFVDELTSLAFAASNVLKSDINSRSHHPYMHAKQERDRKVYHTHEKPIVHDEATDSVANNQTPLLNDEKSIANSLMMAYVKRLFPPDQKEAYPLEVNTIEGYPYFDPDHGVITSYQIPPQRHMEMESKRIIQPSRITEPKSHRLKKEFHKQADIMKGTSYDIFDSNGVELASVRNKAIPPDIAVDWVDFEFYHLLLSVGYCKGCPANLKHDINSLIFAINSKEVLYSAKMLCLGEIISIAPHNNKSTNTTLQVKYKTTKGTSGTLKVLTKWLDFFTMEPAERRLLQEHNKLPSFLQDYYLKIAPKYLSRHGISPANQDRIMKEIRLWGYGMKFGSALLNTNTSRMSIHQDSKSPLPTLLAGSTNYEYISGVGMKAKQNGGLLFLADGLVPIPYAHNDIVLLNPEALHGVSVLQTFKGTTQEKEMTRFSSVMSWRMEKNKNESWETAINRKVLDPGPKDYKYFLLSR